MSVLDELKVRGFSKTMLPDIPKDVSACLVLNDEMVISRHHDGRVLSRVKDPTWDLSPYSARGQCKHNFVSWTKSAAGELQVTIEREMKSIQMVRFHYYHSARKVNSVSLSGLRRLADFCEKNGITLYQLFNDGSYHSLLLSSLANLGVKSVASDLYRLVGELYHLRVAHPGFKIAPIEYSLVESLSQLACCYSECAESFQQTKLIPSRIYAAFIVGFASELDFFNLHSRGFIEFCERRQNSEMYGDTRLRVEFHSHGTAWEDAVVECGLEVVCERYSIAGRKDFNVYLNSINYIAKSWIHLFSGMRDNEARTLPANTIATMRSGEETVTILRGYTSKTAGQNNFPTYWISSPIVERAIAAARSIGRIAAIKNGWDDSVVSEYPLFPALGNVKKTAAPHIYASAPLMATARNLLPAKVHARIAGAQITEADLVELERFDGFRDWRSDKKIKIGQPWPLTSHQCRRSLAVYSARSGIVGLGALANQYKHLTETMTSYYRSDQVFAENFLSLPDQQNLMREMEFERRVAGMLSYENDVINSSGRLWGGEGNRIQVSRDRGKPLIITTDREATARKFEKGEMVYKESPLGGCTNLDSCDKIGFISIFACLDCQYAVLDSNKSIRKIRYGISNLQQSRGMFPPSSPFYKQLSLEIDTVYQQVERAGFGHEIEDLK